MSITNGIVFDPIISCIDHDGDQVVAQQTRMMI